MKLSVIVPAYKVEPYLPACLEGLARSDADGEFLIVNAGSLTATTAGTDKAAFARKTREKDRRGTASVLL